MPNIKPITDEEKLCDLIESHVDNIRLIKLDIKHVLERATDGNEHEVPLLLRQVIAEIERNYPEPD